MLLQKKGADIWTQRSSKRLKSVKSDTVTAKVSQQDKRKANLEAQCGNMHLQQLKLLQAFLIKKNKKSLCFWLGGWNHSIHDKMFPDDVPTEPSDRSVWAAGQFWESVSATASGCSWLMSEGEKMSLNKSQKLLHPRLHGGQSPTPTSSCCVWW